MYIKYIHEHKKYEFGNSQYSRTMKVCPETNSPLL